MENAWGGERFPREANFPETNASHQLGQEPECACHPYLAKGRWMTSLACLWVDRVCGLHFLQETGGLASVYTGFRRARAIPWDCPATVGVSAEKCRFFR